MSLKLEHRPLLANAYSDEDLDTRFNNRRSRKSIQGAAFIITRWPDYWWSVLVYWWIMIGVVALTFMLVYNTLAAFVWLPATNSKELTKPAHLTAMQVPMQEMQIEVYMHVFSDTNDNIDLTNYLPYVENISTMYPGYIFNLIVIVNDTHHNNMEKEILKERNDEALGYIFKNETKLNKIVHIRNNVLVRYIHLSRYMDESPLKLSWRYVDTQIVPFLIRLISIWDKGGIVFNPVILTYKTPDPEYMNKLTFILKQFQTNKMPKNELSYHEPDFVYSINKNRPNNIQDIIKALENETSNNSEHDIAEAESIISKIVVPSKSDYEKYMEKKYKKNVINTLKSISVSELQNKSEEGYDSLGIENHYMSKRNRKLIKRNEKKSDKLGKQTGTNSIKMDIINQLDCTKNDVMCLDLKGNLMATKSSCHAFIGTIFSTIKHFAKVNNVTELLSEELTIFCKGSISKCVAVAVL